MKTTIIRILIFFFVGSSYAQVGIGTTNPQGALDVNSTNMGIVLPRVTSLETVTNADGSSPAVNGTMVYDVTRQKLCHRINNQWVCTSVINSGTTSTDIEILLENDNSLYFKASNTEFSDQFGRNVSISDDGTRMAISANLEGSDAVGVNGDESNNNLSRSGAVYLFYFDGTAWVQEAYLKASNTGQDDWFGTSLAMSGNGSYLIVGSRFEDSNATGVNGNQSDNSASNSGAAYVFVRSGTTWSQQAYLKASNTDANDLFGWKVSIDDTGSKVIVGALGEDSNATGINGNQSDNSASGAGAAYIFSRSGTTWSQDTYLKGSNTESGDEFGVSVFINGDGTRAAVSAFGENSAATGINGNEADNTATDAGAAYVFLFNAGTWTQEAYIKASNTDANDDFGYGLTMSDDGSRLVVSTIREASSSIGVNGVETNNSFSNSGAVYIYSRSGTTWSQEAYVKATNTNPQDIFGYAIALNDDGSRLLVGATSEDSNGRGLTGDPLNNTATNSGAAYALQRSGSTWSHVAYIKSSNSEGIDGFGTALAINGDGTYIVVGAIGEDSNATGIGGDQTDNSSSGSGAAYVITPF